MKQKDGISYPRIFLKQILTTKFLLTFFFSFLEIRNFDTTIDHYCDIKCIILNDDYIFVLVLVSAT